MQSFSDERTGLLAYESIDSNQRWPLPETIWEAELRMSENCQRPSASAQIPPLSFSLAQTMLLDCQWGRTIERKTFAVKRQIRRRGSPSQFHTISPVVITRRTAS